MPLITDRTTAIEHLLSSIHFPPPLTISPVKVVAEYHGIWVLSYTEETISKLYQQYLTGGPPTKNVVATELILRISGNQIPLIKTENEVATLKWLAQNTSTIPVPQILHYDNTSNNPIGEEYMIMSRSSGVDAGSVYATITPENMDRILEQMAHYHIELFKHPFYRLGGLRIEESSTEIKVGPPLNEHYFQTQQIEKYWPKGESYSTLNTTASDGYPNYVSWIAAHVECYIHGIEVHDSLSWAREHIPRLREFLSKIQDPFLAEELNNVPLRLAHNDLHFHQFLIDPQTFDITAVLDWEFASVVPFPLWRRSFLMWLDDSHDYVTTVAERERLYVLWEDKVRGLEGGEVMLDATKWKSRKQELVWNVCNHLRGIGQVCVYGSDDGLKSRAWMADALKDVDELLVV